MSKKNSKHIKKQNKTNKTNKKHYNKSYTKLAFIIVLILIIAIFVFSKGQTINNKYEKTQIIFNNENITANIEKEVIIENDIIYISFNDVKKVLDKTIYQEEAGEIITTSSKKIARLKLDDNNITINGATLKAKNPVISKDGEIYIAISELQNVYDYEFKYIENSNIVVIDSLSKKCVKAYAKKNIKIKEQNKAFSKVIEKVQKENWVYYIDDEENGFSKIRTQNGNIGYVKKHLLDNFVVQREEFDENVNTKSNEQALEYDITSKDITTFEKRQELINIILQEAIKNDKMYIKILYNGEPNTQYERFKIEAPPMLQECGITVEI